MRKMRGILAILVAILVLGVGYATISNVTLEVNGTATATADPSNFIVRFKEQSNFSVSSKTPSTATVTQTRSNDTFATFSITGLTKEGDSVVMVFPVENASETLDASLAAPVVNFSNTAANEYFTVSAELGKNTLVAVNNSTNDSTNLTVTVTVAKTPITQDETTTGSVRVVASPVNPSN